jgi:hypothetical protein
LEFRAALDAQAALTFRRKRYDGLATWWETAGTSTTMPRALSVQPLRANVEMEESMTLNKILLSAAATGFIAVSTVGASAAIVCSGNVCWHTTERYTYPPEARVKIHEDTFKPDARFTFREHEGRGYWKGDSWTTW